MCVCVCEFAGLDSVVRSANKSASVMKANTAGSMKSFGAKSVGGKSAGGKSAGGRWV